MAYGFPVPPRIAKVGGEIPFEIMLRLAGIKYAVTYDNGPFPSRFSTLLFPSAHHPPQSRTASQSHSAQWHLIKTTGYERMSAGVELARYDHLWFKIKDEKLLQSARTLLGYRRTACVHLCAEDLGFSDVLESSIANEKPSPIISVRSGTIGTSESGIFGAAMNVDVVLPRDLAPLPRIDCYNDIIRTAKNKLRYQATGMVGPCLHCYFAHGTCLCGKSWPICTTTLRTAKIETAARLPRAS